MSWLQILSVQVRTEQDEEFNALTSDMDKVWLRVLTATCPAWVTESILSKLMT